MFGPRKGRGNGGWVEFKRWEDLWYACSEYFVGVKKIKVFDEVCSTYGVQVSCM